MLFVIIHLCGKTIYTKHLCFCDKETVPVKALNVCIRVVICLHAVQEGPFSLAENAEVDILQCSCFAFCEITG